MNAPGWNAAGERANALLAGLACGVFTSRDPTAIERVFDVIAEQRSSANTRTAAILEAVVPALGGKARAIDLPRQPRAWAELARRDGVANAAGKLADLLSWPGKPARVAGALATPLTARERLRFDPGRKLYLATCAPCHQPDGR